MPCVLKAGDRVETMSGSGTVVGFVGVVYEDGIVGGRLVDVKHTEDSQFAIKVRLDHSGMEHVYANINVQPTVTTEIIHALRSAETR